MVQIIPPYQRPDHRSRDEIIGEVVDQQLAGEQLTTLTGMFLQAFERHVMPVDKFDQQVIQFGAAIRNQRDPYQSDIVYHPQASMREDAVWRALDHPDPRSVVIVQLNDIPQKQHFNKLTQLNEKFIAHTDDPNGQVGPNNPLMLTREALYALELLREQREMDAQTQKNTDALRMITRTVRQEGPQEQLSLLGRLGEAIIETVPRLAADKIEQIREKVEARMAAQPEVLSFDAALEFLQKLNPKTMAVAGGILVASTGLARIATIEHVQAPASAVQTLNLPEEAPKEAVAKAAPAERANRVDVVQTGGMGLGEAVSYINQFDRNALGTPNNKLASLQSIFMAVDLLGDTKVLDNGWKNFSDEQRVQLLTDMAKVETGFDPSLKARNGKTPNAAAGLLQIQGAEMAVIMMQYQPQLHDIIGARANQAITGMYDNYVARQNRIIKHARENHFGESGIREAEQNIKKVEALRKSDGKRPIHDTGLLRDIYRHATESQKDAIRDLRTDDTLVTYNGQTAQRGGVLTGWAAALLSNEIKFNPTVIEHYGITPIIYLGHQNGGTRFRAIQAMMLKDIRAENRGQKNQFQASWAHYAVTHDAKTNAAIWMTPEIRAKRAQQIELAKKTHRHVALTPYSEATVATPAGVIDNVKTIVGETGLAAVVIYRAHLNGEVLVAHKGDLNFRGNDAGKIYARYDGRDPAPKLPTWKMAFSFKSQNKPA